MIAKTNTKAQNEHYLEQLAQEIAPLLGRDWSAGEVDEGEYAPQIILKRITDGLTLTLNLGGGKYTGRLFIALYLEWTLSKTTPTITVADSTVAERIAKAIQTRLLPNAEPFRLDVLKRKAEAEAYVAREADVIQKLIDISEGHIHRSTLRDNADHFNVRGEVSFGFGRIQSPTTVRFEALDVPVEMAYKIAALLAQ